SWGPRAIGDHGAPVSLPKLKKAYEKSTRGISWGPLLTPGPRAVPEFPNGQSAPGCRPLGSAQVSKWSVHHWVIHRVAADRARSGASQDHTQSSSHEQG
ncbi:unnamed protein product, partial [Staurois parvus]